MDPATGAVDSLLPKLEELLLRGKLRKSARKEVDFVDEELTGVHRAFPDADELSLEIKEWASQARPLSYNIEHIVDKFLARRLKAAHPPKPSRHKLIRKMRFQIATIKASHQFTKEIQKCRDRIKALGKQLISQIVPETGAIDSLLAKLNQLLITGDLRKKAKKQVVFLQLKLTSIQRAFRKVEDVQWLGQARALSYGIEHVVDKFLARRLRAANRHKLGEVRFKVAIANACCQLAKDIQSYRDRILELDIQLIGYAVPVPATGAIDSLLPKLNELTVTGKLRKSTKKQVFFLQEKLTGIQHALRKVEDAEWASQARTLSYDIEHAVHKFLAHRLSAANLQVPAADRHKLIGSIRFKLEIIKASRQFAKDVQIYKGRIMELDIQPISYIVPETGAIDSLLPKLDDLLTTNKLEKSARKQVIFLQQKLTEIRCAFEEVEDVEWARQARILSYGIEHALHDFLARQLSAAHPPAAVFHKLIRKMRFQVAIIKASRQFTKDIQSYTDHIMALHIMAALPASQKHADFSGIAALTLCPSHADWSNIASPKHPASPNIAASNASQKHADSSNIAGSSASPKHSDFSNIAVSSASPRNADSSNIAGSSACPKHADLSDIAGSSACPKHADSSDIAGSSACPKHADSSDIAASSACPKYPASSDIAASSASPKHADSSNVGGSSASPKHSDFSNIADSSLSPRNVDQSNIAASSPIPRHAAATAANNHNGPVEELVDLELLVKKILVNEDGEGTTSNRQLMIASIFGAAGVGKTTLVNQVYQKVNSRFECTAWVTVSPKPDIKNVLRTILCQISLEDDADFGSLNVKDTIRKIRKALNNKRYFIVVEDLWDITARETIKRALTENSKGSAVLMTSRNASVARFPGVNTYRIGPLIGNSSTELSAIRSADNLLVGETKEDQHTMLESSDSEDWYDAGMTLQHLGEEDYLSELMEVKSSEPVEVDADCKALSCRVNDKGHKSIVSTSGEENSVSILNTQEGKPLLQTVGRPAIPAPGDTLGIPEKNSKECGANLPAGETKEDGHTTLESSNSEDSHAMRYTAVPEHLKSCLLYLSMFQNGYEISVDCLVSGWIAEGYIPQHAETTPQRLGEDYLNDLMGRNLIKAVKIDADGKVLSCCVNDTGHKSIALFSAEENSVTILKRGEERLRLPQMIGRLAIQGHNVDLAEDQVSIVRSLIISGDTNLLNGESSGASASRSKKSSGANVAPFLSRFENLRVLELGGCDSLQNGHLNGIKSLLLLRYLVIGGKHITDIPKDIGSLVFLQTLDLRATSVEKLPRTIVRARQLKCLRVNGHTKMPRGIRKMKALEELGDMNISDAELLKELSDLTNLIILRIVIWSWDDGYNSALLDYLGSSSMKKIKSLSIFTCCSLHIFGGLKAEDASKSLQKLEIAHSIFLSLPVWIHSHENLSCLSIEVYKLSQDIINTLGKMKNLLVLSLKSKQEPKGNFNTGFEKLISFRFVANAVGKIFEAGAMEKVERLHLSFQASCTEDVNDGFDFGLKYLSSLQYARVEILCFNANLKIVEKAKQAIADAITSDHRSGSRGTKLDFDLPDEIESDTHSRGLNQADDNSIQQNQQDSQLTSSDPSTSASAKKKFVPSRPAQFCDRCGSEFVRPEYHFCPGCGTRRLTVQKK